MSPVCFVTEVLSTLTQRPPTADNGLTAAGALDLRHPHPGRRPSRPPPRHDLCHGRQPHAEHADSRYWGFVPRHNILGRPMFVYWSFQTPADEMYKTTLGQRISFIAHIVRHFFTDTRWSRAFHIIRYASLKISSFGWCGSQFPSLSSGESRPELFSSWRLRLYQLAHRPSASTFGRPQEQCRVFGRSSPSRCERPRFIRPGLDASRSTSSPPACETRSPCAPARPLRYRWRSRSSYSQ